jgi:carbamoyl-phosphate synthase large subunit
MAECVGYPIVIKPSQNQGSRGVFLVLDPSELRNTFDMAINFSLNSEVIIEKYIEGEEYVVEGIAANYEFKNLIIGDTYYFDLERQFVPKHRLFPALINKTLFREIEIINSKIIHGFGLKQGITHSEFIRDKNSGELLLIETAARGGGAFISSDLIAQACNVCIEDIIIDLAIGKQINISSYNSDTRAVGYICFYLPDGIITSIEGLDRVRQIDSVHKVHLSGISPGQRIFGSMDKTMRKGIILIVAESRSIIDLTIRKVQQILRIKMEGKGKKNCILWN